MARIAVIALAISMAFASPLLAQGEQSPSMEIAPSWEVFGFGTINIHNMSDFNREIARLNNDARATAEWLSDRLGTTLSVSGRIPDLNTGYSYGGGLLYRPVPFVVIAGSAESLTSSTSGSVDITANERGVSFIGDFTINTLGFTGIVGLDLSSVIEGPWGGLALASWGFFNSSADATISVKFSGIEQDPRLLDMETRLSTNMSGTGYRLELRPTYLVSPSFNFNAALGFRGLMYDDTDFNFNELDRTIDVDLSGFYASGGVSFSF